MAIRKDKYKTSRRKFGQACGKYSFKAKLNEKAHILKLEQKIKVFQREKRQFQHSFQPYQLVRKQYSSHGTYVTKFVVRRIPVYKDRNSKLLRLGHTSLKFRFHKDSENVSGYRLINIENLKEHIVEITTHSCLCAKAQELVSENKDPLTLKTEINRCGLFSVLMVVCEGCNQKFPLKNSNMIESRLYDINIHAVWGTVATGGGPSDLNELLGTMNVPMMSDTMFTALEQKIGLWWNDMLKDEMAKAGAEEKRIAIEKGSFHEGVPAISVICDGGWSKRTHKHTYNAYGGVAVIFGAETQKLLYIGVRNKHCSVCRLAKNQGVDPKNHNCFANWKESSQAMEADIILSGFLEAESTHGVRYLKIIADGDSSVFATLQEKVPVWGKEIKKLECANHVCKCVRSNLEKLVQEKPQYKGKGKLTKHNRVRLTTALRCAIKMRSKTNNAKQLRKDILNSIYHVLGFHDKCSDFCKKRPHKKLPQDDNEDDADADDNSVDSIFDNQTEYWKSPSGTEIESSRLADKNMYKLSELQELINDVLVILNKVADKSDRLLGNFTTNLAESWMAIRAKFDGGKVINRCNWGSWNTRCYGGALRKNLGSAWSPLTFQTATETEAGIYFHQLARRQTQQLVSSKKYKAKPESKDIRRKRKLDELKETTSKKAKIAYGSNLDDTPDVSKEKLAELCDAFLNKRIRKNDDEIQAIENASVGQCNSDLWKKERHIRLTSSNFGKIMPRRLNNVSTSLAERMLYSKFKGNIHTIRGLAQEKNTIIEYENKYNVQVKATGFRICKTYPCLGASTDGLVHDKNTDEHGLLEIKKFLQTNTLLIKDAARKMKNFCLEEKQNKVHLKTNHEIYYQIQGQLNIFEKEWCDFVLRRTNPYDIHVERIYRDSSLWENEMVPKLEQFYQKFLLPELALPRYGTYSGIRKPTAPWFHSSLKKTKSAVKPNPLICAQPRPSDLTNPRSGHLESREPNPEHSDSTDAKPGPSTVNKRNSGSVPIKDTQLGPVKLGDTSNISRPNSGPTVIASTSAAVSDQETGSSRRSRRAKTVKFVGRQISHKWILDEASKKTKWYSGTVLEVIKGFDGEPDAEYKIHYDEENVTYDVDDVYSDYLKGWIKFTDV